MAASPTRSALPDHYAILGVAPEGTLGEIKAAYRRRSRELHPDRNASPDANRQMAALNAAFAVLSSRERREEYDIHRPRVVVYEEPRPPAIVPAEGPLALQPERLPDWYEFLDLHMNASSAEVIEALNRTGAAIRLGGYASGDDGRLQVQLKRAAETLTNPRVRAVYDAALNGMPPAAGTYPEYHETLYSYIGVRATASGERLAEAVTSLSAKLRKGSREYRELEAAWKTLRNPETRAKYDAARKEAVWGTGEAE